jgi:peptidyl-tRNA hydrolase
VTSTETLVQPIVLLIDKDAPPAHLDAVKAAASASVDAIAEDCLGTPHGDRPEVWRQWLSGPFTKTVRRANPKQWAKLPAPTGEAACGTARAVAYRPASYDSLDKAISRLQVSGTDLSPAAVESPLRQSPVLLINASLGMTTGKAAAQAAHALMAYWLKLERDNDRAWAAAGSPFSIIEVDAGRFAAAADSAVKGTLIRDNGLTEIAPGSATAMVLESADDLP